MLSGGMIGVLTTLVVALILCGVAALIFWIVFGSDFETVGPPRAAKRSGLYVEVLGFGVLAVLASSVLFFLSLRNAERMSEPPAQVAAVAPLPVAPVPVSTQPTTPSLPTAPIPDAAAPAPADTTVSVPPSAAPSPRAPTAPVPSPSAATTPPPIPVAAAPAAAIGPPSGPTAAPTPAPSMPVTSAAPAPGTSADSAPITEIEPAAGPLEPPISAAPAPVPAQPAAVPSPSPPVSPETASVPPTSGEVSTPAGTLEINILMERGDTLRGTGDVVAARLFYERAAEKGSAAAARAVGETYDPLVLEEERVRGVRGDQIKAIDWYRRAILGGDKAAVARLRRLVTQTSG